MWEFNLSTNKVFCKACTVDFKYGNDNLKFRIESRVKIEKHTISSRLSSRNSFSSHHHRVKIMTILQI